MHGIIGGADNEALERRWHYLIGGIYAVVTLLYVGSTIWHFWGARQHK